LRVLLAELDAVPTDGADEAVDAAVLRTAAAAELMELHELREAEWNPMVHNPGGGLHALLSREFAPLPVRLASIGERLAAIPAYLDAARARLSEMSCVHVETAVGQFDGTIQLVEDDVPAAVERARGDAPGLDIATSAALAALREHRQWLVDRVDASAHDPRIGPDLFRGKLALTLDTGYDPQALLARAEAELTASTEQIVELAGQIADVAHPDAGTVRDVLDGLAADAPTDTTILARCTAALAETTAFVRDRQLVSVYDDPVEVVVMPEIDRGVAVAYCRQSGPLEATPLPTEFAVSPTPSGWSSAQVDSFYREYNDHMLHNLTVHEAMPGHALQLMHANRHRGGTPVRAVWWSGSFVEGWAVYAEELLARHGYRSDRSMPAAAAVRMQQLKMRLRMTLNAIMDIRFHCGDLDESAAMALMRDRGFQEEGEAAGKWRRVQLSSTQLCTYYVGYTEVRDVVADLRTARPGWSERQLHDTVLAHGSPPARHLRTLLGLPGGDERRLRSE
jgi:hypothetical protein